MLAGRVPGSFREVAWFSPRWRTAPVPPGAPAGATPTAATLYREAMATTNGWRVHLRVQQRRFARSLFRERRRRPGVGNPGDTRRPGGHARPRHVDRDRRPDVRRRETAGDGGSDGPPARRRPRRPWSLGRILELNPAYSQVVVGVRSPMSPGGRARGALRFGPTEKLLGTRLCRRGTGTLTSRARRHGRRPLCAGAGRHRLVEEDTVNARGPGPSRAYRLLEMGRNRSGPGPRLPPSRSAPSTDVNGVSGRARRGSPARPWENGPLSSRRSGCRRERPMRRSYRIAGTVAATLAAAAAGVAAGVRLGDRRCCGQGEIPGGDESGRRPERPLRFDCDRAGHLARGGRRYGQDLRLPDARGAEGLDHRGAVGRPDRKDRICAGERIHVGERPGPHRGAVEHLPRTDGCPSRPAPAPFPSS